MAKKETISYDDVDILPIEVSYGDQIELVFQPEDGELFSDDNFRVVIGNNYNSETKEEYTIANNGIVKVADTYVLDFDSTGKFDGYEKLVFDVFGHADNPKRRIAKGTIEIKKSFL